MIPKMSPNAAAGRALVALVLAAACGGNPLPGEPGSEATTKESAPANDAAEPVTPPFEVKGELEGLLLVWFDAEGQHSATRRSDVPEARRAEVRVDSLRIAPDKRLDPEHVYVADVRAAQADGSYAVHKRTRAWFEARVEALTPKEAPAPTVADTGVTLYRTAWCGVCKSAASYFRKNGIAFVEKDVEQDPGASEEMLKKARSVGRTPHGVPVIDFHGNLIFGFDEDELDRLVRKHKST